MSGMVAIQIIVVVLSIILVFGMGRLSRDSEHVQALNKALTTAQENSRKLKDEERYQYLSGVVDVTETLMNLLYRNRRKKQLKR